MTGPNIKSHDHEERVGTSTKLLLVWLALMMLSAVMFFVGMASQEMASAGLALLLAATYCKCRLVIMRFMEVSHVPAGLRLYFEIWLVAVVSGIALVVLSSKGV